MLSLFRIVRPPRRQTLHDSCFSWVLALLRVDVRAEGEDEVARRDPLQGHHLVRVDLFEDAGARLEVDDRAGPDQELHAP